MPRDLADARMQLGPRRRPTLRDLERHVEQHPPSAVERAIERCAAAHPDPWAELDSYGRGGGES